MKKQKVIYKSKDDKSSKEISDEDSLDKELTAPKSKTKGKSPAKKSAKPESDKVEKEMETKDDIKTDIKMDPTPKTSTTVDVSKPTQYVETKETTQPSETVDTKLTVHKTSPGPSTETGDLGQMSGSTSTKSSHGVSSVDIPLEKNISVNANVFKSGGSNLTSLLSLTMNLDTYSPDLPPLTDLLPEMFVDIELMWHKNSVKPKLGKFTLANYKWSNHYEYQVALFTFMVDIYNHFNKRYVAATTSVNPFSPQKDLTTSVGFDVLSIANDQTIGMTLKKSAITALDALDQGLRDQPAVSYPYTKPVTGILSDASAALYEFFANINNPPIVNIETYTTYLRLTKLIGVDGMHTYSPAFGVDQGYVRLYLPERNGAYHQFYVLNRHLLSTFNDALTCAVLNNAIATFSVATEDTFAKNMTRLLNTKTTEVTVAESFVSSVTSSGAKLFINAFVKAYFQEGVLLRMDFDITRFSFGSLIASMLIPLMIPPWMVDPLTRIEYRNYFCRWGLGTVVAKLVPQLLLQMQVSHNSATDFLTIFFAKTDQNTGVSAKFIKDLVVLFGIEVADSGPAVADSEVPVRLPANTAQYTSPRSNIWYVPITGQVIADEQFKTEKVTRFIAILQELRTPRLTYFEHLEPRTKKDIATLLDEMIVSTSMLTSFWMHLDKISLLYMHLTIFSPDLLKHKVAKLDSISSSARIYVTLPQSAIISSFFLTSVNVNAMIPFDTNVISACAALDDAIENMAAMYTIVYAHFKTKDVHASWDRTWIIDKCFETLKTFGYPEVSIIKLLHEELMKSPHKHTLVMPRTNATSKLRAKFQKVGEIVGELLESENGRMGVVHKMYFSPTGYGVTYRTQFRDNHGYRRKWTFKHDAKAAYFKSYSYDQLLVALQTNTLADVFTSVREIDRDTVSPDKNVVEVLGPVKYTLKSLKYDEAPDLNPPVNITQTSIVVSEIPYCYEWDGVYYDQKVLINIHMRSPEWFIDDSLLDIINLQSDDVISQATMLKKFTFTFNRSELLYITPSYFKRVIVKI